MYRRKSKRWTRQETVSLLQFYNARKTEFNLPRKRRLAFARIREEMISAGYDANITVHHLEVKMHTLLRAYKAAKDKANAVGTSSCHAPFFEELDNIFGDNFIKSKSQSIDFGAAFDLVTLNGNDPTDSSAPTATPRPKASPNFTTPKRRWTKKETMTLLHFYSARKKEFDLPRKRKLAFARVLKDMLSVGFDPNIKVHHLEVKMQTLLRSYRAWKDNPNATGDPLYTVPLFQQLENIFGDNYNDSKCEPYSNADDLEDDKSFGNNTIEIKCETYNFGAVDLGSRDNKSPSNMDVTTASTEPSEPTTYAASTSFTTLKRRWTKKETMTFLHFYNARKKEFKLPRKKRLAFSRVLEDMLAVGFDPNIKVHHLEVKMQTMLRPYSAWKRNTNPIGDPLSSVPFFQQLEDIFGNNSIDSQCEAYLNADDDLFDDSNSAVSPAPYLSLPTISLRDPLQNCGQDASDVNASTASTTSIASIDSTHPTNTMDIISRSEYRRRRLEQKDRKQKASAERWREYMQFKKEWEQKKLDLMEKFLKQ